MKMVVVHSSIADAEQIASGLEMFAEVVVAQGMSQVRAERAAHPIFLLVSQDIADRVRERVPDIPMYIICEPFDLPEALRAFETAQKAVSGRTPVTSPSPAPQLIVAETPVQTSDPPMSSNGPSITEHVPFRTRRIPIVVFVSPKGGQGRTTVLTHMAAYGAAKAKRIAIIDLDVNCNAAEKFGQTTQFASDGWRGMSVGDALGSGMAVEAMPNVYVFSYGRQLNEHLTQIDHADVQHVLGVCMEELDAILIDTKQEWSPTHGFLLPMASQLVYVVASRKDALANLSKQTRALEQRMSGRQSDVFCILNQTHGPKDAMAMAAYIVPYSPDVTIPFDSKYHDRGGLGLKVLVDRCAPWWDRVFGFPSAPAKKGWKLPWFGRRSWGN